ncbi:internal scaffolding protein [Sigmofec virus UA08Rod_5645]|uniref:Internal scaffolding protein n=1 Tax=Sigmofec virus UA08Rod_5645 TaxID=2929433 RepID=A0A976N1C5_9VIRU|nr:internal scaffolding protein [Sigmofec virus UA08Rod_5645]
MLYLVLMLSGCFPVLRKVFDLKFGTQFDHRPSPISEPGSREHVLYSPIFDKQGRMSLEATGVEDLYDYIQSHADSVDIHVILKRFEQGDVSVLSRVQGAYGDFTQMPKTFAEALNTLIAAEQYFNSLPVDVRAQFGHNFNQFIASMDAPDFTSKMGIIPPDVPVASSDTPAAAPAATPSASDSAPPSSPSVPG